MWTSWEEWATEEVEISSGRRQRNDLAGGAVVCRNAGLETVDYREIPGGPQGLGLGALAAVAQISIPV